MDDEAFCGRFFRGSILPVGEHCEPTGKIEPRKNLPQNPHRPCVCTFLSKSADTKAPSNSILWDHAIDGSFYSIFILKPV